LVDNYIQKDSYFLVTSAISLQHFETSHCRFFFPDQTSSISNQFSRVGDFHTAMVKNAIKTVARAQMVRSFILCPFAASQTRRFGFLDGISYGRRAARHPASPLSY
jgi:hypothetical protein